VNSRISTDVELASHLSDAVAKHYRDGARCIEALPQYALVMFRQVLEALCEHVQRRAKLTISPSEDLHNSIRRLTEGGLITFGAANAMHRVRKVANAAAHIQPESTDPSSYGMCQCHETTLDLNLVSFRFSQRAR
jgi:hypothetical protein